MVLGNQVSHRSRAPSSN